MNNNQSLKIDSSINDSGNAVINEMKPAAASIKLPYYNRLNLPPKVKFKSDKPSEVFESPDEIRSPQDVMNAYGMYSRDTSMFPNNNSVPIYGDFSVFKDFSERANLVANCKSQFEALPSEIRAKFGNNINNFADYVNSSEFDYEYLMTDGYKQKVWYPEKERLENEAIRKKEEFDYQSYLYKKSKDEIEKSKNLNS